MKVDDAILELMVRGDTADPHALAEQLSRKRSLDVDEGFMHWALLERVKLLQRQARNSRSFVDGETPKPGPSQWRQIREVAPFVNKFVADLTAADLREIIDRYDQQLAAGIQSRARYERLLTDLKTSGCATVGEMRARESVPA
jgi:hypothetical protein